MLICLCVRNRDLTPKLHHHSKVPAVHSVLFSEVLAAAQCRELTVLPKSNNLQIT